MSAAENSLPEYINHFLHFENFAKEIEKYELFTPEEAQKNKNEAIEILKKQLAEAKPDNSLVHILKKMAGFNTSANTEIRELEKKLAHTKEDIYCANDIAMSFKKIAQQALYLWQADSMKHQENVRVAIIGDFSSGKSSFINSLLGENFCPVDVAASTSSITTFEYGDIKRIFCVDGDIKTEILLEDYNKLVTHQGKSGKKYQFEVFYPFDGFRDLELFDTPGFNNSNNNEDEKVTLQKCQLADVIFFVFDINKGDIGNDIKKKLLAIKEAKPSLQIHAIVNKSDQKPPVKIKEIERQLKQTGLFVDVVSYSSKKELDKYQLTSFNTVPNTLEHLSKQLTNANNSQWLIKKENAQIVVKALNQQLSEQRQIINSWFETIHKNNIKILQQRLEKQKQEYYEHGKHLLLKTSDSLDNYARAEAESVLPALKEFFELLGFFEDESGFFNFIKQKLKTHLEKETATMPVSNEEKSFIFSPFYKNVFYGFDSSYNRFNTKNEIYDDFLLALDEFYKRLNNMKAYFANHPTQLAHRCSIRLTEKLNDYTYKINTAFAGYYDNKEIAINHLRSIIDDNKFQDSHAMVISNIIFSALSDWYDDVRNYESNNKGYLSAKNEAALALKQQLDDFYTSFA